MKLFEYLAAGRPIVASKTPAICQIVSEKEVLWYAPDNAHSLAKSVQLAVTTPTVVNSRLEAAKCLADASSWRIRAERIVRFIKETTT